VGRNLNRLCILAIQFSPVGGRINWVDGCVLYVKGLREK
jgi:hypothetical protein